MAIKNLEAGVERAMKAYLKEAGASDAEATSRVAAKLAQGVALVKAALLEQDSADPNHAAAFTQLKTWTLANA